MNARRTGPRGHYPVAGDEMIYERISAHAHVYLDLLPRQDLVT